MNLKDNRNQKKKKKQKGFKNRRAMAYKLLECYKKCPVRKNKEKKDNE